MPLEKILRELEEEINNELKDLGLLPVRIDGFDSKTRGLEWANPYNGNNRNEYRTEFNKVIEVVRKHFEEWLKKHSL